MTDEQPVHLRIPREQMRSVRLGMYFVPDVAEFSRDAFESTPPMAYGTGFYYKVDGKMFLVTARHNCTGRDNDTNAFLGEYSTGPTHLHVVFREAQPPGGWRIGEPTKTQHFLLPLLDNEWKPRWLEHPEYGARMDVAVLPLTLSAEEHAIDMEAYGPSQPEDQFPPLAVAQDVFVVGYPYGLESGWLMPLWVRGTIASEPSLYYEHRGTALPIVLIDARARKGQSGSPVILYRQPRTPLMTADNQVGFNPTNQSRLIGVYSGRTSNESDLGFVWRIEAVDAICRDGITPTD